MVSPEADRHNIRTEMIPTVEVAKFFFTLWYFLT